MVAKFLSQLCLIWETTLYLSCERRKSSRKCPAGMVGYCHDLFSFSLTLAPNTGDIEQLVKQACYLSVRIFPLSLAAVLMLDVIS